MSRNCFAEKVLPASVSGDSGGTGLLALTLAQGALLWLCEQSRSVIQSLLARLAAEQVGDRPGRCERHWGLTPFHVLFM